MAPEANESIGTMSKYLIIFVVINAFGLVNRGTNVILELHNQPPFVFGLYLLQALLLPLQGFGNAVVHGNVVPAMAHWVHAIRHHGWSGELPLPSPQRHGWPSRPYRGQHWRPGIGRSPSLAHTSRPGRRLALPPRFASPPHVHLRARGRRPLWDD